MFSAVQIAEWFVRKGIKESNPLDLLQVMKLAYIAHGCYLAIEEKPLFGDQVEAWKYGVTIYEIYVEYRNHGKNPIKHPHESLNISRIQKNVVAKEVLSTVYDIFSGMPSSALMSLTRRDGSPWSEVYNDFRRNIVIENGRIGNYYKNVLEIA